jgi:hypothetical protein
MKASDTAAKLATENAELKSALTTALSELSKLRETFLKFSVDQAAVNSQLTSDINEMKKYAQSLRTNSNNSNNSNNNSNNSNNSNIWNEPQRVGDTDPKLEFCKYNLLVTVPLDQLRTFTGPLFIEYVNQAIAAKLSDPATAIFKENLQPDSVTLVQRVESRADKAAFRVRLSDPRLKYTVFWVKAMLKQEPKLAWSITEELTPLQKAAQQRQWTTLPAEMRSKGIITWLQGLEMWCRLPNTSGKVQVQSPEHARSLIAMISEQSSATLPQNPQQQQQQQQQQHQQQQQQQQQTFNPTLAAAANPNPSQLGPRVTPSSDPEPSPAPKRLFAPTASDADAHMAT